MATLVKRTLEQNEAIIEMGVRSFIDVGNALMDIRDKKQYADKFDSFEGYCQKRWGFTRQRARQYIESTVAVSDLTTIVVTETDKSSGKTQIPPPVNEAQARAVAEAADDAETRQRVWKEAVELAPKDEAGKPKVTASVVKKAAEKVVGVKRNPRTKSQSEISAAVEIAVPREPGEDEPEVEHRPRTAATAARNGMATVAAPAYDRQGIEKQFGALVRSIDEMARVSALNNSPKHREAVSALSKSLDAFKALAKECDAVRARKK